MAKKKSSKRNKPVRTKPCPMCQQGIEYVDYKDLALLKSYVTDRGRIKARRQTGACAQHQSKLAEAIKNAREMALIPYLSS
jgi:small subunit ribosomal protein S18